MWTHANGRHWHDQTAPWIGWYENGCACGERHALLQNYEGDVRQLHDLGFDGVKLDGCGAQRNMSLYAQLMKATGKSYLIENCHWGRCATLVDARDALDRERLGERLESATVTPARELGRVERWDEGTNLTTSVAAAAADEGDAVEDSRGIISVKSETIAGVDRGGRSSRR